VSAAGATGIWVVSAEQWPRAYLRAELIERGYAAVGFAGAQDVLAALASRRPRPQLVVFDLRGQARVALALALLRQLGIPVVGIAGAREAASGSARAFPWAALLRRPVSLGEVADTIGRALPKPAADAALV
jgi:DNA-binding NtrC family response regulator